MKTLEIDTLSFGGDGIARIDGKVCFVTGALPGEKVLVDIKEEKKNFSRGVLKEIIIPSPDRIESVCPLSFSCNKLNLYCSGCQYLHLTYEKEIEYKDKQFSELLKKFALISDEKKNPPLYHKNCLNYRNKITLHKVESNSKNFGFVSNDNITVLEIKKCYLACAEINNALETLSNYSEKKDNTLIIRYTTNDGVIILHPAMKRNSATSYLTESTDYGLFFVNPFSFFQINSFAHNLLLREFKRILEQIDVDVIFDLYCGVGVFGLLGAKVKSKAYCVDIDSNAIAAAKKNAIQRNLNNVEFFAGDAFIAAKKIFSALSYSNICVVIDPPRTGLTKEILKLLCAKKPKFIIYISCAADTLSRDLKILLSANYQVVITRLIDMFPRTKYFETITLLEVNAKR